MHIIYGCWLHVLRVGCLLARRLADTLGHHIASGHLSLV